MALLPAVRGASGGRFLSRVDPWGSIVSLQCLSWLSVLAKCCGGCIPFTGTAGGTGSLNLSDAASVEWPPLKSGVTLGWAFFFL